MPNHIPTIFDRLEAAALAGDEGRFLSAYKQVNWTRRSPEDFGHAVRPAIRAGAHLVARQLAAEGARRYPERGELQKMARILAPPTVTRFEGEFSVDWKSNRQWLSKNWSAYRGRWVALQDGQLLAVADSLDGIVAEIGEIKGRGIFITPVM